MSVRWAAAGTVALAALLTTGCAHGAGSAAEATAPAANASATHAAAKAAEPYEEDEGPLGRTPAAKLATTIGCVDYEPQERAPGVDAQGACRIGTHRLYVQTFKGAHSLKRYVQGGPGPKPTGADVIGPTWIVHVDDAPVAPTVQAQIGGHIVPAT